MVHEGNDLFLIEEYLRNGFGKTHVVLQDQTLRTVGVKGALPGEVMRLKNIQKMELDGAHRVGYVDEIVQASPHRVSPLCPHFFPCGGCCLQHASYEEQVRFKKKQIDDLFIPLCENLSLIEPLVESEKKYQYRNKMELSFSQDRQGKKFLGLFSCEGRRRVISLQSCPICPEWMVELSSAVLRFWEESSLEAYNAYKDTGSLQTLTMRNGETSGDRLVMLTVSANPSYALSRSIIDQFVSVVLHALKDSPANITISLRIRQACKNIPTSYYEMILHGNDYMKETISVNIVPEEQRSLEFHISPQAFFQPNTLQARKIYEIGLRKADLSAQDVVFDLYCGIGVFGMLAASYVQASYGIEISPDSAYDAKTNSERLGIKNFFIKTGDVGTIASSCKKEIDKNAPIVAIVDPPRAGLTRRGIVQLQEIAPHKIVYVSCNPRTQAEDVAELLRCGWKIRSVTPIDQFPQTYHIENIVSLCRN